VLAFGGLTVGGTGKSSLVRWFARSLAGEARGAVLLRGYGAARRGAGAELVPDYRDLDAVSRVARYGDDALAHRAALPRSVAVAVGADRREAARAGVDGFGARVLLLDDGWEQGGVKWNLLYAVLDPDRPAGNGAFLPAGPLRRPAGTLREADAICFVLDGDGELPPGTRRFLDRYAPEAPVHRFRRRLLGFSRPGDASLEPSSAAGRVGLLTGVGSPGRAERFLRAGGLDVAGHAAFPNHAAWSPEGLRRAIAELRGAGADTVVISEKDEPRWPRGPEGPLPVRVARTELDPLPADPDPLARVRTALGRGAVAEAVPLR
jgi:tetraacyldisaccharide 4'-kinase